jgi:hypothetical protein
VDVQGKKGIRENGKIPDKSLINVDGQHTQHTQEFYSK